MPTDTDVGLARVVVVAPRRRVDLALPEQIPLGYLLPAVLAHAGEAAESSGNHSGWLLRRRDGSLLDTALGAAAQRVRDGELLYLVPAGADWPEPEYDDVVEAIAAGARHGGLLWDARATRWTAVGVAGVLVAAVIGVCLWHGPQWTLPGALCLLLAAGCLVGGAILSHVSGQPGMGLAVSGYAVPAAFVGGLLVLDRATPLAELGAPHVVNGSTAVLLAAVLGHLTVGVQHWLFVAAGTAGAVGCAAGIAALTRLDGTQTAAGLVALLVLLLPAWPVLAARVGRLPLPELPRSAADLMRDEPPPPAVVTAAAVARGDRILTGLLVGSGVASATGLVILAVAGGTAARATAAVAGAVYLLRARLFPTVRHRLPMVTCGVAGLTALLATGDRGGALWTVPALAAGGVLAIVLGVRYAGRRPSVYLARLAEVLEIVLLLAVAPLACGTLGVYSFMRGIAG